MGASNYSSRYSHKECGCGCVRLGKSGGVTYDLVDLGDLGLEDGDGISDRGLLGSSGDLGSSEAHGGNGGELA